MAEAEPIDDVAAALAESFAQAPGDAPKGTRRHDASRGWGMPRRSEAVWEEIGTLSVPAERAKIVAEAVGLAPVDVLGGTGFTLMLPPDGYASTNWQRFVKLTGHHRDDGAEIRRLLVDQARRYRRERYPA